MKEIKGIDLVEGIDATVVATFEQKVDWANYKISFQNFQKLKGRRLSVLPLCIINHTEDVYDYLHFERRYADISEFRYFIFFEDKLVRRSWFLRRWNFAHKWNALINGEELSGTCAIPTASQREPFGFYESVRPGYFDCGPNWSYSNGSTYRWIKVFKSASEGKTISTQMTARNAEYSDLKTISWLASSKGAVTRRTRVNHISIQNEIDVKVAGGLHKAVVQISSTGEDCCKICVSVCGATLEAEFEFVYIDMNVGPQDTKLISWPKFLGEREVIRQALSQISNHYVNR